MENNIKLTQRQKNLFKIIVEQYISHATPIASKEISEKFLTNVGPATIRNEMAILEKYGLIDKTHTSSGRIPTTLGYKYYQDNILESKLSNDLKLALKKIFSKRLASVENIIEESVELINETLKLPSIITSSEVDECLKRIDLVPLHSNLAIVFVITSSGNIVKNTITFKDQKVINDLSTCVRIFNDRLIDTPISQLNEKLMQIKPLIKDSVQNYEFIIQEMFGKIFDVKLSVKKYVSGAKYLINQPEFKDDLKKLKTAIELLDDTNIWQQIAYEQAKTGKTTLITTGDKIGSKYLSIASTTINSKENTHQIAILGPQRMNYSKIKGILEFLKEELEKKINE